MLHEMAKVQDIPLPLDSLLALSVTVETTPSQRLEACHVAADRKRGHDHCRKPTEDLGSPSANHTGEFYGALAEILARDYMKDWRLKPEGLTLSACKPPNGPDFTLDGLRYDVKAILPGKRFVTINAAKHQDEKKRPDYYLPVRFLSREQAILGPLIPAPDVDTWELREDGHSPYYSAAWEDLLRPPTLIEADVEWEEGEL